MTFLKKSLIMLKEKLYKLFLLEAIFLSSSFFFLVFAKEKLTQYMIIIQDFIARGTVLPKDTPKQEVLDFLNSLQGVTTKAMLLFFSIPLILFILWCVTQSLFWKSLKGEGIKSFKPFFWKLTGMSLLMGIVLSILIMTIPSDLDIFADSNIIILITAIVLLLLTMLTTFFAVLENEKLIQTLKKTFKLLTKKIHKIMLFLACYAIITFILIFLFFTLFVTYTFKKVFFLPSIQLILYLVVCLVVAIWIKIILQIKVDEVKHSLKK